MATIPQSPGVAPVNNTLISAIDIIKPIWDNELKRPYNDQGLNLLQMYWMAGSKEAVAANFGETWEEDRYDSAFAVKATVAAPGAGATITFKLAAAYIDSTTRYSYPIVGQQFVHQASNNRYQIISKSDDGTDTTIIAAPLKAATNSGFTANDTCFLYSVSVKEGSDEQATQVSFETKYTWYLQILKKNYQITDIGFTDGLKPIYYAGGDTIMGWNTLQTRQDEYRHLKNIVGAMWWGQTTDNTSVLTTAYSFQTTSGIIEQFIARAVNEATGGTLTTTDFSNVVAGLSANWSGNDYLALLSLPSFQQISTSAGTAFANANVNALNERLGDLMFGNMGYKDVSALMGTFSFNGLALDGFNFALMRNALMDDPSGPNASTTNIQKNYGVVLPAGGTNESGVWKPFVKIMYKQQDGLDLLMRMYTYGGMSPQKTDGTSVYKWSCETAMSFAFYALQQCALFKQ